MKSLLVVFVACISYFAESQIIINEPAGVDELVFRRKTRKYKGYRVQIGYSKNYSQLMKDQDRFFRDFPDIPVSTVPDPPYWNLKAGNFRTEIEALKLIELIKFSYTVSNVLKEEIEIPSIN